MLNYHATFTKGTIEFRLFQLMHLQTEDKRLYAGQLSNSTYFALSELAKK